MTQSSDKPVGRASGGADGNAGRSNQGTVQQARDQQEKLRHPASENDLESAQDKNPVPPGGRRSNPPDRR